MRKIIILIFSVLMLTSYAEAKMYVCLDRSTGEPVGTVDIREQAIGDWSKQLIMIEADEAYRGKQGFEIRFEGQKLRKATDNEISSYNNTQASKVKESRRRKAMEDLGLTESDLSKIKAIKE